MRYRRARVPGGTWFFTLVTYHRIPLFAEEAAIEYLREALRSVRKNHPFQIDAMVVLPDHLHCIWTLPSAQQDFSTRWRLVKSHFTKNYKTAHQKPFWQPRYWEHLIRDENDLKNHIDYIHYNPVKHGYVRSPAEWSYSSVHRFIERGELQSDWGLGDPVLPEGVGKE